VHVLFNWTIRHEARFCIMVLLQHFIGYIMKRHEIGQVLKSLFNLEKDLCICLIWANCELWTVVYIL
jgi:hypothetical protein